MSTTNLTKALFPVNLEYSLMLRIAKAVWMQNHEFIFIDVRNIIVMCE